MDMNTVISELAQHYDAVCFGRNADGSFYCTVENRPEKAGDEWHVLCERTRDSPMEALRAVVDATSQT